MTIWVETVKAEFEITDNYEVQSYQWEDRTIFTLEEFAAHLEDGMRVLNELEALVAGLAVEAAQAAVGAQLVSDIDNGLDTLAINGNEREL